jgi:hypothetical protein
MKVLLLPLGMRCNAAMAINPIVNQPRLPFDWAQMNVNTMVQVFHLSKENTPSFWESYFSNLDDTNHNKTTGSWLPHDTFSTEEERKISVEKYVRRTIRLQETLTREEHKIFVIFFGFPEPNNMRTLKQLYDIIDEKCKTNYSIIACNVVYEESILLDMFLIYERLHDTGNEDSDWADMTTRISKRISDILTKNEYEAIPVHDNRKNDS